jgi:hypothetical protein
MSCSGSANVLSGVGLICGPRRNRPSTRGSCCVRFPCVHAAATTPVQRTGALLAQTRPSVAAFPETTIGSACTSSFSRIARRLLTLRPAHSRGHQNRDRYPKASDISSPPCLLRLLPAGAIAGWALHPLEKRRLVTAHVASRHWLPTGRDANSNKEDLRTRAVTATLPALRPRASGAPGDGGRSTAEPASSRY